MKQYMASLRTAAWVTAGARYNAARRLKQREAFSTFSMAALSALTIAVAFAQRVYSPHPGTSLDNYLAALSMALGVFLLAISLLEWGAGYGAKADALHRNAEELTAYQRKLELVLAQMDAGRNFSHGEIDELRGEYEGVKAKCAQNHTPLDYELFKAKLRKASEFLDAAGKPKMSALNAMWIAAHWHISTIWFLGCVWLLVSASLAGAFWISE